MNATVVRYSLELVAQAIDHGTAVQSLDVIRVFPQSLLTRVNEGQSRVEPKRDVDVWRPRREKKGTTKLSNSG